MSGPINSGLPSYLSGLSPSQQAAYMQMLYQQQQMQRYAGYSPLFTPSPPPDPPLAEYARPDARHPDTLGWRMWVWSESDRCLKSPHQDTLWPVAELSAAAWSDDDAVRGVAGIHARLLPKAWRLIGWPAGDGSSADAKNPLIVTGIIERFGRYVLGTTGWRSERVVIRELMAPSTEIGLAMEQVYPDVAVHYADQLEGVPSCKSEKSSALGKGSRSPSQPFNPPSFQSLLPRQSESPPPSSPLSANEKTPPLEAFRRFLSGK